MSEKPKRVRPKRNIVKMEIDNSGKAAIRNAAEDLGMKDQACLGRLVMWFADQDDVTQKYVLGVLPKGYEVDILEKALERHRQKTGQQGTPKK